MICELLQELRPLKNKSKLYNSYEHAIDMMSKMALETNSKQLILASLLHEVEDKLGAYTYEKCLAIIEKAYPRTDEKETIASMSLAEQVKDLLERYNHTTESSSKLDWAVNIIENHDALAETLLFADLQSELKHTTSNTVKNCIRSVVEELIKRNLASDDDARVISILQSFELQRNA